MSSDVGLMQHRRPETLAMCMEQGHLNKRTVNFLVCRNPQLIYLYIYLYEYANWIREESELKVNNNDLLLFSMEVFAWYSYNIATILVFVCLIGEI